MINGWAWLLWFICWLIAGRFVHRTRRTDGQFRRLQYSIPMGLGFLLIFHGRRHGQTWIYPRYTESGAMAWIGNALTFAGLAFSGWARAHLGRYWSGNITLKEGHKLIRTGPYRMARHPLYTGFLTAALGSAIVASTGDAVVGFALILIAILIKIHREERLMLEAFGPEYRQFQAEVSALVPLIY
jgi:protein-S-isoprenylcysteine O-methyltransferase Ste14